MKRLLDGIFSFKGKITNLFHSEKNIEIHTYNNPTEINFNGPVTIIQKGKKELEKLPRKI